MSAPTAAQAMAAAAARLRAAGVPDPARDARILLAHAASVDAARVTLIAPEEIAPEIAERYEHLVALRAVRVPCLLYTSPSPRDRQKSRMPSSA